MGEIQSFPLDKENNPVAMFSDKQLIIIQPICRQKKVKGDPDKVKFLNKSDGKFC